MHHPQAAAAGPDQAMRITLYWILFLGQTIGDATILSLWGFVFLSTVLFSIFCYTLELERLGRALVERKDRL
jgi:hypothetical protein